ncbi:MAG: 1-acyl-sn-glycerol-3-phosphate acyltransferase [Myxococcales bacterium]|nr:1-acyl-sn-glycerol-3-phosphate acyltransferase [Myxococcales bacterium]
MTNPIELVRSLARGGATVATTLSLWACLDAQTALSGEAQHDRLRHDWVHRWARALLRILAVRLEAEGPHVGAGGAYPGRAANGASGRLFVMNHRSAIDILVTFAVTEAALVSRHDLASWPVIGSGARRLGTLFVDRESMRSGAAVLELITRGLAQGRGVAIYPEGTAYPGDEVHAFKPGSFRAAKRAGAEIIPLGIAYDDEAAYYGDESFGAHVARLAALPELRVALVAGEPLQVGERSPLEVAEAARVVVQSLVERARRRL